MKVIIVACGLLFIGSCTQSQPGEEKLNCSDFKNGTFEMFIDSIRIVTERNDNIQIERTSKGDSKYQVTWNSECEYILELLETNLVIMENKIWRKYKVNITSTEKDMYSYEVRVEGMDYVGKGSFSRVE